MLVLKDKLVHYCYMYSLSKGIDVLFLLLNNHTVFNVYFTVPMALFNASVWISSMTARDRNIYV